MAMGKKGWTQTQIQTSSNRRGSVEDGIKVTDPNMLVLDEIRKIRQEMKELRFEMKEDIKESSQETREEIKETRAEIRKDLKKELDCLGKKIERINSDLSKTQKEVEVVKEKTMVLEKTTSDLNSKQEQLQWKDLNQDLKLREKRVKIRGVPEIPKEDLFARIIQPLAVFLDLPLGKMELEIDQIFRMNSSLAKDRDYPRDIVICCVRTRIRDLIIQTSYDNRLVIEDKEVKIFKDIPPSVMLARQKYKSLVSLLRNLKIDFKWDRIEGLSFFYFQKRYRIDNIGKAKEIESKIRKDIQENRKQRNLNPRKERESDEERNDVNNGDEGLTKEDKESKIIREAETSLSQNLNLNISGTF